MHSLMQIDSYLEYKYRLFVLDSTGLSWVWGDNQGSPNCDVRSTVSGLP